ncbi:Uncharacterized protein TCM_024158 [Theobroma cacao]|uniref:RNase H type-1 domain-containing protein n=1 Tax=Theobroma cacao TaxID=3641 RepID=A0A061EUW9_THECC|nr:Uncharacterized protein TCM_024158 [Theobroma cacao]
MATNWSTPPPRTLKLNTDGVAKGKPRLAGNEGVIRDHHGFIRETFSENIGIQDSNFVKFYAIREGISLFFSSPWVTTHSVVVENDSANAINWVQHHCKVLWRMKNTSNSIETFLRRSTRFTFKQIMREANNIADGLAKAGVLRDSNFKAYFQNQ